MSGSITRFNPSIMGKQLKSDRPLGDSPTEKETIAFHELFGVCNGGHIANAHSTGWTSPLNNSTVEDIAAVMGYQTKAIIIVQTDGSQDKLIKLLEECSKIDRNDAKLRAKKLAVWSSSADLWMVRHGDDLTWE